MNRSSSITVLASVFLLSLPMGWSGCSSMEKATSSMNTIQSLLGEWNLDQLGGKGIDSLLPAGMRAPSLNIGEDGRVSGFSGVNRITSMVDLEKLANGEFALSPVASTKMAGPPEAMKLEDSFNAALQKVTRFKIDGDTLNLSNGRETLMRFIKG